MTECNDGEENPESVKEYTVNQMFTKMVLTIFISAFIFATLGWIVGRETGKALMLKKAVDKGYAKSVTYIDADNNTNTYIGWNDDETCVKGKSAPKQFGDVKKMSDEEFQKLKAREEWVQSAHILKIIREMTPAEKQEIRDSLKKLDGAK